MSGTLGFSHNSEFVPSPTAPTDNTAVGNNITTATKGLQVILVVIYNFHKFDEKKWCTDACCAWGLIYFYRQRFRAGALSQKLAGS